MHCLATSRPSNYATVVTSTIFSIGQFYAVAENSGKRPTFDPPYLNNHAPQRGADGRPIPPSIHSEVAGGPEASTEAIRYPPDVPNYVPVPAENHESDCFGDHVTTSSEPKVGERRHLHHRTQPLLPSSTAPCRRGITFWLPAGMSPDRKRAPSIEK